MAHHAHHHNDQRHVEITITRPMFLRIAALLTLVLPAIFYLLSMSFTLATIFNKSFAESYPWQDEQGPIFNISYHASPFFFCNGSNSEAIANFQGFNETCFRLGKNAIGNRGIQACHDNTGNAQLCSQRVLSAELIVAGAVLGGIAIIGSVIGLVLGLSTAMASTTTISAPGTSAESAGLMSATDDVKGAVSTPARNSSTSMSIVSVMVPFVFAWTTLIAVIAGILLVMGQVIGYNALVILQPPKLYSDSQNTQTRWVLGKAGQVYMTLAYCFAALGVLITVTKLGIRGR